MLTRMTRMARMLTHMLTRMTRWLAYYTHSLKYIVQQKQDQISMVIHGLKIKPCMF